MTWNGQFCPILNFSHQGGFELLKTANCARFATFLIFFYQSGTEWLGMAIWPDLQLFQSFPTKEAQNDSKWPILPDSQLFWLFLPKRFRMTWNGQFCLIWQLFQSFPTRMALIDSEQQICLIHNFPSLQPKVAKNDSEWPILPVSQLFLSFYTKVAQNDLE